MRVSRSRILVPAFAVAAALTTGGCHRAAEPPPSGSHRITIPTPDGEQLDAIELGTAHVRAAILSHGATGTKEDFYGLAQGFAEDGWRVIAYDARGVGSSTGARGSARDTDLRAVVSYARRTGAQTIVLAGGSLGASLSIAMAQELRADAVISLSAPASTFGALDAARALKAAIPILVVAARDNEPFTDDARQIAAAAGVTPVIVSGDGHGTGVIVDHPDLVGEAVAFADDAIAAPASG